MNKKILILFSIGLLLFLTFSCAGSQQKKEVQQKSFEAYYSLGVRYLSDGEYQKALIEFRKAESFQPKDPQIHNAMGLVYYYMQKFNDAEKEYKKAVSIKKDYSEAYVNLGTILAQQGKYKDAILQFRKALKNPFYPTPAFSLHNIGLCYQGLGNKEKAETAMQEAIQNDPNFIRAYFDLGKILLSK